jgi:predicted nucleotidyltransferase
MISLRSTITNKLLSYFFINPHQSLYVNELGRALGVDKRNLVKKLKELEAEGVLRNNFKGNLKLYSINTAYPFYAEYRRLILKTTGFECQLKALLQHIHGVEKAYIYGSYARGKLTENSDIDVLVIGAHRITEAQKGINLLQKQTGREINVMHMSADDFDKRRREGDPFVSGIMKHKLIQVI